MAINKATLAKEIDGVIEYIYPKTSGDIVVYDDTHSVSAMISMLLNNKMDKVEGKGFSTNDFTNEYRDKLENIESGATVNRTDSKITATSQNPVTSAAIAAAVGKLENKHSYVQYTLRAAGWDEDGVYNIESEYPTTDYYVTLMVGPMNNDQFEQFSAAHIIGSELDPIKNYFKAIGEIPTMDIPVIFDIKKTNSGIITTASTN